MIYLIALPLSGLAFVLFVLVFHAVRSARPCWAKRYPGVGRAIASHRALRPSDRAPNGSRRFALDHYRKG